MTEGYSCYQPGQPQILCTFLYPADWKVREIVENGYVEIFVAGPRNGTDTYSTSFTVSVTHPADQTPIEAATSLLSQFHSTFTRQEWGPDSTTAAGLPAIAVEVAYAMPLPPNSSSPEWTVVRERSVFFQHEDQLYELNYAAPEEEYAAWLEAFRTLVDSLAFSGEPAGAGAYHSLEATISQSVREVSSGYDPMKDSEQRESES